MENAMSKKLLGAIAVLLALLASSVPTRADVRASSDAHAARQATQKRYAGVITALDAASMTIQGRSAAVTGRVDAGKTKVFIDRRPVKTSELKVTYVANAELGLDDVWSAIYVDSTPHNENAKHASAPR
jgi:hypothetical protein